VTRGGTEARVRPEEPGGGVRVFAVDGFEVLVGKGARDNERLTFRVARPDDLWLHAAGYAGSHVLVRAAELDPEPIPPPVVQRAAELAVWFSKARDAGGKVPVHVCRAREVSRRRGAPPGQVVLRTYHTVRVYSRAPQSAEEEGAGA
jgi:predicted ribosome quality control (RQC) complex YloA/Tae2 family protein